MVWGWIMGGQKTDLVVMQGNLNARRYIDDVLRSHLYHLYITRVHALLFNMAMQDPTPP